MQSLQDSAIAVLQLDHLLSLLESQGLIFTNPTINSTDDSVLFGGEAALLGTTISLDATFQ